MTNTFDDIILNLNNKFKLESNKPHMLISKKKYEKNNIASCLQIHSNHVQYVDKSGVYKNTDGLVTHIDNNISLVIQTADCVPIFMLDSNQGIIGLIHSGWKGTSTSIILSATSVFSKYGSNMSDIKVYLGPWIQSCCYEIKNDVSKHFDKKFIFNKNGRLFLDLGLKIQSDLISVGVENGNIFKSDICTYENQQFCSYRRDNHKAGRMYSIIG